jgi:beta-1,4-mannosyl-glycoprotein beta-1,4-N-acetylglucosaminyltransferase
MCVIASIAVVMNNLRLFDIYQLKKESLESTETSARTSASTRTRCSTSTSTSNNGGDNDIQTIDNNIQRNEKLKRVESDRQDDEMNEVENDSSTSRQEDEIINTTTVENEDDTRRHEDEIKPAVENDQRDDEIKPAVENGQRDDQVKRVTVIDNTFYDGEPVLLFRLAALYDKVDRFYIVESNFTMDGQRKESLHKDRNEDLFEPFKDKIRWIVAAAGGDGDEEQQQAGEGDKNENHRFYDDKRRDIRTLTGTVVLDDLDKGIISEPFVVINSDVDEIINPNDIDEFQPGRKYHDLVTQLPVILQMESFEYNMNWKAKNKIGNAEVLPGRLADSSNLFHLPNGGGTAQASAITQKIDSGYRFGNFFDVDGLSNKMNYTGAQEKSMLESIQRDEFAQKCVTGEEPCVWKRRNADIEHWDYKQAPAMLQKFHETVCKIQNVDPSTGDLLTDSIPQPFSSVASEIQISDTDDWTPILNDIPYKGQNVTVIDAIQYNGEPIVLVRLATLNDVVDRFYLSEGTHFHSGAKKEKFYKDINSHLFEPYKDKIHWIVHDMSSFEEGDNWGREKAGRKALQPAIREDFENGEISHPFVVINADADEIPDPQDIANFQPGQELHVAAISSMAYFNMSFFYYNLNWKKGSWQSAHTIPGHLVLKGFDDFNFSRKDRIVNWVGAKIQRGYHMSYFMDVAGIKNKLESFAHQEYNLDTFKTQDHILKCISKGEDLIGRRGHDFQHWDYKQAPIPLQKFHEETCQKQGVDSATGDMIRSSKSLRG